MVCCIGRSCLHYVQWWKSDVKLAPQRLNVIDFLINRCGANVNVQVTLITNYCFHAANFFLVYHIQDFFIGTEKNCAIPGPG